MADSESWPGEIETPASAGAADVWPGQILSGASQNTWPGTIEAPPSPTVGTPEQPFSQGSENAPADPYAAASFEELQQRQAEDQRSLDQRYEDATAPHRLQEYAQRRQQEPQRPPQELDAAIKQDWAVPQMGYDLLPNPVGRAIGYVARGGAFGADEADLARRQKEHLQQRWDKTAAVRLADYQRLRQQFPDRAPQEISDVVNRHYGLAGTDFTGMNSGAVRPTERSVAGEVTTGLERFFAVDAPDAFAAIVRAVTPRDSVAYKWARSINEDSEFIGKQDPNQAASLDPELHPGTAAFRQGAEMLPISVVPNIAAGRLMLGFGVPTRIARFLGPALGLIPDVVQQGYQSRDKVEQALLDKGENPDTARRMAQLAGVFSGFIEGFGETVDDFFGPQSAVFKALGMGWVGKKSMREALVSLAEKQLPRQAAEEFIKEFLFKTMPIETATEMGQQFGEASVEQAFGAPANEGTPWEQAKAVIGPTLAMNVLMLPGIGMGVGAQVQQHNTVHQLLTDGQANPVERLSAGTLVLEQLKELDKRAAVRFRNELETALNQEQPLPLENFERFFNAKPQSSAQGAEVALGTPGQQTPIDLSTAAGQRDLQQEAEFHKFDAAIPEGSPDDPNGEIFNEIFGQGMQESKALAASGAPVVTAATLVDRFRQRVAELKGVSAAMPAPPLSAVEAPPGVPVASPPTAPGGPTAAVLPSTASAPSASTAASPAAVPLGLATALGGPGSAADEQAKAIIEAKARGETPAPAVGPVTTPGATPQPPREVTRPTAEVSAFGQKLAAAQAEATRGVIPPPVTSGKAVQEVIQQHWKAVWQAEAAAAYVPKKLSKSTVTGARDKLAAAQLGLEQADAALLKLPNVANDERLGTLRTQGYQARVDAAWQALPVRQAEWQTWLQTQAALKTNAQATSDKGENLRQLDDMVSDLVRMQVLQPHAIDLVNEAAAMHARVLKGDFGKQFAATPDWMQANYGTEQFTIWNAGKVSDTKPLNITYARALQTAEEYQRYWETQQLPANGFNDNDLTVLRWLLQTTVDHALENAGDGMTPEYSAQIQAILKRNALGAPAAGRGGVESEKSKVASVPDSAPAAAPTPSLSTLHFPLSTTSTSPAAPIETPPVVAAPVTPPIAAVNAAQPSGTPGASAGDTLEEVRGQKSEGISQTEKKKDAMPPPVKRPAASRKVARAQPKAAAKEPWQMRSVALVLKTAEKIFPLSSKVEIKNGSPVYTYETTVKFGGVDQRFAIEARSQPNAYTQIERLHKKMIERALAEGKPVPSEVLADYPDLQKQAEAPPVKPPKPPAVATAAPAARDRAEALGLPFTLDTSIDKLKRAIAKADAKGKPDGLSLAASPEVTLGTGPASGAQEATGPGGEVKTVMPPPVNKERAPVVDKNERSYVFVPAPDGQQDWGHITQQIADEATRPLVVAPLRVQEGWHGSSGDGLGRVHVQDHWRDMRKVGYTSPEEFLHYVLRGFTRMYFQPKNGRYWLTRPNGGQAVAVVELQLTPEQFYGVTTAYPERANKKIGAELIWERREPAQQASGQPVAPSSPTVSTPVSAAMAHGPDQSRAQGNIGAPAGEVKARAVQTVPGFAAPQRSKAAAATFPEPTTAQIKSAFKRNDVATVLANSKADAGPFDGGCLIVAHAFLQLLPQGKLVRMESLVDGQPQAEHYGVRFPDGRILDADGFAADGDAWIKLFSEQELLRRAAVVKEGWIPSEAPSDPSAEKKLANVLRQAFIAYAAKKPAQAVPSLGTPAGDLFQALEKTAAASKTSKSATPAVVPTSGKKARVMPPPMPSLAERAAAKFAVALRAGPLNKLAAVKLMNEVAGGTLAEGKYTDKDLHDAIELAVNQVVLSQGHYGQEATPEKAAENILALKALIENAPTQSTRTPEMDKLQQFSTPPPLAYAVAWLAHVQPGEVVLEPSAGVGGIAVFARMMGGRVLANELSTRRAALLRSLGIAKQVTIENAEHLHAILAPKIAAGELPAIDRVVMNPPFSHGAVSGKSNTLIGAQHVEEALKLLSDGGRLVAIVGEGMALDKPRFRSWWNKIAQTYHVRANIHVDGNEFRKYGTTFGLQVLVIDKTGPTPDNSTLSGSVQKIEELPELLKGVRHDIGTTERGAAEPSGVEGVGQEPTAAGPAADALAGAGQRGPGRSPAGRGPAADSGDLFAQRPNPSPRPAPGGAGTGTGGTGTNVTGAGGGVRSLGTGAGAGSRPSPESTAARSSPGLTEKLTVETVNHAPPKIGEHQVFYDYRPAKVNIPGAQPHPTPLVESSAMASIVPPDPTYSPKIPQRLVTTGALTDVQLEQLVYAGQSHAQHLPNGQRQGYFIGDGTGVGKGRMLAGIILDNWNQGERKAVWISAKPGLIRDAGRDITALGMKSDQLIDLTDRKIMRLLPSRAEGIAFLTYRGLSMDNPGLTPEGQLQPTEKDPRIAALVKWLPKNFKGVIGLDEVHNAGNAIDIKGKMGVEKASQAGKAVVDLQNLFPDARIVLMSATGATEITNLGYGDRLGLWGPGTAFGDKRKFFDKIGAAGPTGMEIVARDNKGRGIFLARTLSFKGVEQEQLVHKLTPDQTKMYDEISRMWQMVMGQVDDTMASTGANKNADARKNALSALYGSQQRFYGQLLTALQMPTVLDDMRRELAAGKSAVLQVVNTNEATQERELAKAAAAGAEDDYLETLDLSPKDGLLQYVNASFPVAKYEMHLDAEGNEVWEPVKDSQGNPVPDPAAVAAKQRLLDKLALLKVPANPMEMLLDTFGAENVAEVTGRSRRVVQKVNPETGKLERQIENRNEARRDIETKEFLDGKRRILIFSDAGGTGFSYHAGATFKNQQPRVHYLIQAGWRSDNAVQGLGRTHRSDQVLPPFYKLVSTDIKGHQRFISTISRRIGQLGALTAGERKAGGAGLFSEENNLENEYARDAVRQLFTDLFTGDVRGFDLDTIARQLGYAKTTVNSRTGERETVNTLIDPKTGGLNQTKLPTVQRFLNRVLVMEFAKQNQLFEEFIKRMERRIEVAKLDGSFDPGLQTLKAKAVRKVADTVVYQHPGTSATTRMVDVDTDYPQMPTPWSKVERNPRWGTPELFVRNKKSGKLYALFTGPGRTDDRGRVLATWRRMGVSHDDLVAQDMITTGWEGAKYDEVEKERAKKLWTAEYAKAPDFKTERETYITGLFTPIWDRIGIARPKIYRVGTTDGDVFLGIRVPPAVVDAVRQRLSAGTAEQLTPEQVFNAVLDDGRTFDLANGWQLKRSKVAGESRLEILGFDAENLRELEDYYGATLERINFTPRAFVPTEPTAGVAVLQKLLERAPIAAADASTQTTLPGSGSAAGGTLRETPAAYSASSQDQTATPEFKRWFGDWETVTKVQAVRQLAPLLIKATAVSQQAFESAYQALVSGVTRDGRTVQFVHKIMGKLEGHRGHELLFRAAPQFKALLQQAIPAWSEPERNPPAGSAVVGFHHYVAKAGLDGRAYYLRFTVQEIVDRRVQLHSAFVSDVEIVEADPASPLSGLSTPTGMKQIGFDRKLADWLRSVNPAEVSKVVDAEGKPLVMYHGTGADFDVFDLGKAGVNFDVPQERGAFFTNNAVHREFHTSDGKGGAIPHVQHDIGSAGAYADNAAALSKGAPNVMPVFLSIKNPLVIEEDSDGAGIHSLFESSRGIRKEILRAAEAGQHDGLLIRDLGYKLPSGEPETIAIVFSPSQIKSATGNRGTFDAEDPNILHEPPSAYSAPSRAAVQGLLDFEGVTSPTAAQDLSADLQLIAAASPEPYHFTPAGQSVLRERRALPPTTSDAKLRAEYEKARKAQAQQKVLQGTATVEDVQLAFGSGRTVSSVLKEYVESASAKIATLRGLKLESPQDTAAALRVLRSPFVESLKVLALNSQGRVLSAQVVTVGTLDSAQVHPREVFANLPPGTKSIVVAHNHPSGDPTPSAEDVRITRELVAAGKVAGVYVADHIITNGEKFKSLRETGLVEFFSAGGKGIPGQAARLPPKATTKLLPPPIQAPWEVLRRDTLVSIRAPEKAAQFARALRQAAPGCGHIIYLTTQFGVTAVTRFPLADIGQIAGVIAREAGWHGAHAFMVDYPVDHANPEFNKAVRALVAAGKVIGVQALDVVALQTDASGRKLDFSAREEGVAMFRENSPAVGEGKIAETPADYGNGRKPPLPPKVTAAAPAGEPEGSGPQTPQEKLLAKAQADNDRLRAKQREQLKAKKAAQAAGKQAMGAVAKDIGPAVQAASEAAEAATPEERKSKGYAAIGLANRAGKRGILRAGAEAAAGLGAKVDVENPPPIKTQMKAVAKAGEKKALKKLKASLPEQVAKYLEDEADPEGELSLGKAMDKVFKAGKAQGKAIGEASVHTLDLAVELALKAKLTKAQITSREGQAERLKKDVERLEEARRNITARIELESRAAELENRLAVSAPEHRASVQQQLDAASAKLKAQPANVEAQRQVEKLERRLADSAPDRHAALQEELARVRDQLKEQGDPAEDARHTIKALFGENNYGLMRRTLKGDMTQFLDGLIRAVSQHVTKLRAIDVVRLVQRQHAKLHELSSIKVLQPEPDGRTLSPRDLFDEVIHAPNFPLDEITKLRDTLSKRKAMKQWESGRVSPEQLDNLDRRGDAYRMRLAEYFANRPLTEIEALYDKLNRAITQSRNEKFFVAEGHLEDAAQTASAAHEEVRTGATIMAGEKQGETVVATRPWLRGRVADAHKGIREICLYLTGKAQSVLERFFYDRMAAAETQKNAANHAERVAFEAQLKELGLTVFDLARWETKFASQKFRMQTGVDQQGEPVFEDRPFTQRISEWMNLWNALKDEDVVTHLDRTGIKNWADRGKLHEGNVLSFGKNNGLAARATLQAACRAVLSERQIKLADYMFERANDAQRREMLNAISRWEFGSDAANMTARWARLIDRAESPMVSAADTLDVLKNGGQAEFDTGFLNKRINHAQPSLMRSVFDVFFEDVNRANSYIHMRMPVLNAIRLLGYKGQNGANIQTDIETRMGKQVYHFLLNQVARSAGYYKVEPKAFDRVVGRIASNAAVAILWGRITSVLNNRIGGSILMISELWQRYGANVALKYLARMALPPGVTRLSSACRNAIAKLNTLSGFLGVRWNEHYRAAVGNFLENAEASEGNNVRAVAWRKFQEWGLKPMEWAEQRNAADAFLALTGSGVSEEEAVRAVEQLTRDTQNTSSALDESQFSQAIKESRLLWFLFPFFSQNAIAGRLFQRDLLKWTAAKGVQAKAIASKNLALTTVGLAASAAAAALISSLFRAAMRGEKWPPDDEHAQLQQVANAAGNLADNLLPGSGRLFDVAQSAIQRGEYQDPSMIGRILDSGISGIHKLATADEISMDDPKFFDGATRLLEALTMLGGIPFGGPYQSVKVAAGLSGAPLVASSTSTPAGSSRSRGVLPPRYVPPRPPVRRALPPRMPPPPRRQS